ncbi:MAG: 4Fe-4S binding protein [Coriobacteriaceae bacterium]
MKNTLVIDLDRCSGCDSCVAACKMENQMNLGGCAYVSAVGLGTFPESRCTGCPCSASSARIPAASKCAPPAPPTATRRPASCS